jgi:hypothetical protein
MFHICRQILKLKACYFLSFLRFRRLLFHCYFSRTDAFENNVAHALRMNIHDVCRHILLCRIVISVQFILRKPWVKIMHFSYAFIIKFHFCGTCSDTYQEGWCNSNAPGLYTYLVLMCFRTQAVL